jgi:hypothetical protein
MVVASEKNFKGKFTQEKTNKILFVRNDFDDVIRRVLCVENPPKPENFCNQLELPDLKRCKLDVFWVRKYLVSHLLQLFRRLAGLHA